MLAIHLFHFHAYVLLKREDDAVCHVIGQTLVSTVLGAQATQGHIEIIGSLHGVNDVPFTPNGYECVWHGLFFVVTLFFSGLTFFLRIGKAMNSLFRGT